MLKNKKIISIICLVLVTALFSSATLANGVSSTLNDGEEYYNEIDQYIKYYEIILEQYENESLDNYNDYNYEDSQNSNEIDQYIDYYDILIQEYESSNSHNSNDDYSDYNTDYNYDYGTNNNNSQNDYYIDYGNSDYNYNSSYDFPYYDYGSFYDDFIFGDYGDYGNYEDMEKDEHIPGKDFLKTPTTIQYTFDLESKYPKYIDTGAVAGKEELLTINSLKEFLRQISVHEGSKFIEDGSKAMTVVDKKLIILDSNNTTGEMLEEMFEETSIKVKVQPSRMGGKFNLADYLEMNGEIPVSVNGNKIELIIEPVLDNSRVLFPIRSIGKALGANVEWNKENAEARIEKDEKVIIFKADSDIITVNGREYLISNKTSLDEEEERLLSVIGVMVVEFGASMEWDAKDLVLNINIPLPETDPDADF